MTLLPASVMTLTPANAAFLRENIVNMNRPDSVVRGDAKDRCEASFRLALKERLPVVEAAETLLDAFRDDLVTRMLTAYRDVRGEHMPLLKDVRKYPLGGISHPPSLLQRLLDEEPEARSWEMMEATLVYPPQEFVQGRRVGEKEDYAICHNGYLPLGNLQQLGEGVYEFLNPETSPVRRMPSLRTMLGLMALAGVGTPAQVQFTSRVSTLPELRDLLENDLRPWCFDVSPYEVHGGRVDPSRNTARRRPSTHVERTHHRGASRHARGPRRRSRLPGRASRWFRFTASERIRSGYIPGRKNAEPGHEFLCRGVRRFCEAHGSFLTGTAPGCR